MTLTPARSSGFLMLESGGTKISSAYRLAEEIIEKDHSPDQWNVYVFQFSDGGVRGSREQQGHGA